MPKPTPKQLSKESENLTICEDPLIFEEVSVIIPSSNPNSLKKAENITLSERNIKKKEREKLWGKTGFQRILGGYWHNYIFNLGFLIFGLVVLGVIFPNYILPFPEAMGFRSVVTSLFALMFTLFDVGIGSSVTRFVAEYVGRGEIKKSIEYLRFFIWFQMITGLIQITVISIGSIYFARNMISYAYLIWVFIIYSLVQYPGMLGIFNSALEAFQRYDKKNIVSFLQMVVFEMTTQIICVLLGRYFGQMNPQIGELMGATIGYVIGLYLDDFLAMLLAAKYFSNLLKPYGIPLWESIVPHVSKEVVKKALSFGLKNMAQGLFYQVSMLMITAMVMSWLPNYATIVGIFSIADSIARIIIQDLPVKAAIAEAYNCGKIKLTDYYIQATFKWYGILTIFLTVEILMLVPPLIGEVAANYAAAASMIPYLLISRFFIGPIHFSDSVQQGCDKPEYAAYSLAVQMIARAISFWIFLSPNALPALIPGYSTIIGYLIADFPSIIAKNIFAWWLINRKLVKVRVNIWQTIISPILSIFPLIPLNLGIIALFNAFGKGNLIVSIFFGLIMFIFLLFGAPILVVFPMSGLMGGWDDRGLQHLHDAAEISGPSRFLTMALYRGANWGFQHTPFRKICSKWAIPHISADEEAQELVQMRIDAQNSH